MKLPERFSWALEVLACQPTDSILEVGCGAGILVEQIACILDSGSVNAIDTSPAMINKAIKRNQRFMLTNKARFYQGTLLNTTLPNNAFDKILAFNVSVFWKSPQAELAIIKNLLKPEGKFYLFHQPPHDITKQVAEQARYQLEINNFKVHNLLMKNLKPVPASCIEAQPL